ncbi:hypothetical protein BKA70DRAFT_1294891 [Coprinopsis sp. MPI-PUGE-AT-0042]|nr:hypothetical protein BKA70DRAFT_1294891 [Coprinopsis sp. MPI-PUGE-AT-0042]
MAQRRIPQALHLAAFFDLLISWRAPRICETEAFRRPRSIPRSGVLTRVEVNLNPADGRWKAYFRLASNQARRRQ